MQTAGGTGAEVVVFLQSNAIYGTQFVNTADKQGYHPVYVNSDWASNSGDTTNQNMPQSYDGAVAFVYTRGLSSKQSPPPPPQAKDCVDIYNKFSGRKLSGPNTTEYGLTMQYCDNVRLFEKLAAAAGDNLTRATFSAARTTVGHFDPVGNSGGTLGPDRFDVPELIRTERWSYACKCMTPVDDFHRPGG